VPDGHPCSLFALRRRTARKRGARRAADRGAPVDRPDRVRRQRHRRPPRHRDAGGGGGGHRAVLAADDGADGHADGAAMRYLSDGMHWTLPTVLLGFGGLLGVVPRGYALTFGRAGLRDRGAGGLGLAAAVMLGAQALAFAAYLARARRFRAVRLFARFERPRPGPILALLRTGLPIGVTVAMEGSLFIVTALLIGRLGAVPVAAHQIAINVAALCFMVPMGLAEATTVRVGHALGRGSAHGVRRAALAGYVLALGTQSLSALLLLTGHDLVVA